MNGGTAGDDLSSALVGVRIAAFLLRHLSLTITLAIVGAGLGVATSLEFERPYESSAALSIGSRGANEPLEMPLVVRERLRGILEKKRAEFPDALTFKLEIPRDQRTNDLSMTLSVSARARTSTGARGILEASLAELLEVHGQIHAFEARLAAREHGSYERAAARVGSALERPPPANPSVALNADERRRPLSSALLEIGRRIESSSEELLMRRSPPTRIVEGPTEPRLLPSRALALGLAGGMLGVLVAIALATFRSLRSASLDVVLTPSSNDVARARPSLAR